MTNNSSKRIIVTLSLLAMLLMPLRAGAQDWFGDVDLNGDIDINDVTSLIDHLLMGDEHGILYNPYQDYLSAKDFGAVGDGETDDTEALERLFDAGFRLKKPVFFDPGTYLIRRSLTLRTGMEIYGDNATITKKPAVTTTLTEAAPKHQTYVDVADASGFTVGDQIVIVEPQYANKCTMGIVTAIEENRIHFTNIISDQQPNFPGCIYNYVKGRKVCTAFALLRSWAPRFECDGVYIHDLTLDGNKTSTEGKVWSNSCIHLDAYYLPSGYTGDTGIKYRNMQRNLTVHNVVIKNSPHDGISDQSAGGINVTDCVIENPAVHGVHVGTRYNGGVIARNTITGNGASGAGVFLCQDVVNLIVEDNTISTFNHGVSDEEFGTCGKFTIIRNNVFKDITAYVFDFLKATSSVRGGGLLITNNTVQGLKSKLFSGHYLDQVTIANNKVTSVTTVPSVLLTVSNCNNVIISGNTLPSGTTIADPVTTNNSTNILQNGNTWDVETTQQ